MQTISTYRIYIYVPSDSLEDFISKISPYIPSFLGNYDHVCWWSEKGVEQYREIGCADIEQKPSHRVEISLPYDKGVLDNFVENILIPSHPWKEPVIIITEQKIVKIIN